MNTEQNTEFLTLKQAADITNLSESKLRQMINSGELKVVRSNGETGKILTTRQWLLSALMRLDIPSEY